MHVGEAGQVVGTRERIHDGGWLGLVAARRCHARTVLTKELVYIMMPRVQRLCTDTTDKGARIYNDAAR